MGLNGNEVVEWPGWGNVDFGPTEEGFVRYQVRKDAGGSRMTSAVAMYFTESGEFWVVNGSIIAAYEGSLGIRSRWLFTGWSEIMDRCFAVFDRFGASLVRRVEVGVVGMRGARWPLEREGIKPAARSDSVWHERKGRDWSEEAKEQFLVAAYNKLGDQFSLRRKNAADLRELMVPVA